MADIGELIKEIKKYSSVDKQKFDAIKFTLHKKLIKTKRNKKNSILQIDDEKPYRKIKTKEEIYHEMKEKFRFAWKGKFLI